MLCIFVSLDDLWTTAFFGIQGIPSPEGLQGTLHAQGEPRLTANGLTLRTQIAPRLRRAGRACGQTLALPSYKALLNPKAQTLNLKP